MTGSRNGGRRHYDRRVAPRGDQAGRGAFQLADRLGVELYERTDIKACIERVNLSSSLERYITDAEIHGALIEQHNEYLGLLTEAARVRVRAGTAPEVRQRFEQTKAATENRLD